MIRQNRQYIFLIFAILLALFVCLACKSQMIPGNWLESEMRIDGKIDDWQGIPVMYFEEEGAAISFCNDSSWLYIQFRTTDSKWARTIKMSGITLYFDTQGKENKNFFIKYRGGPSMKDLMDKRNGMIKDSPFEINPMRGDTTTQFTCYIKDRIVEKPIHTDGSEGPAVAFDTSYSFYSYEFRLPLQESTVRYYGLGIDPGSPISIGAVWGDMEDQNKVRPDMGEMSGGFGGGRGGGQTGGGNRGGGKRGGTSAGKRPNMSSKQEVWLKSHLVATNSKIEGN